MGLRRVTFMAKKAVFRICLMVLFHYPVPCDFGYYRRRGNRQAFRVAANYAFYRAAGGQLHPAIHYHIIRGDPEIIESHLHSVDSGPVYINGIDRLFVDYSDTDVGFFEYLKVGFFALLWREFF